MSMKAVRIHGRGGPKDLKYEDAPIPLPQIGEALIKVHAVAVTPLELTWEPTHTTCDGRNRELAIPGHEFSGVISQLGDINNNFRVGDEVYGRIQSNRDGAQAEFVIVKIPEIALKPNRLNHVQSAAMALSAITAWQGLFVQADLQKGQRVLVTGAAGGVGLFAVQLAKWKGAYIIGTGSTSNVEFVRDAGANEVVDYTTTALEDAVSNVDLVLDCVGGDTLLQCDSVVKDGGTVITVATPFPSREWTQSQRVNHAWFIAGPDGQILQKIALLADEGWLKPMVDRVLPLSEARQAYEIGASGHGRGKVVLRVSE